MLEIQRSYIHNNLDVNVYFITFDENLSENIKIVNDIIYIKGKESYINILYKTIKSLEYIINFLDIKYDYIIRTNISTIIHFDNLINYLDTIPKTDIYVGGKLEVLNWILQPHEISEKKMHERINFIGLKYIQGFGIIFSYDVIKKILMYSNLIEYDIVDDVKLGLIIKTYCPETYTNIEKIPFTKVTYNEINSESIFIRNKTSNRLTDIYNMRNIVNNLYDIKYPNYEKIIHITNKTLDKLENIKNQWLFLNPDYKIELYDDSKCLIFLEKYYGKKYCDIFNYIKDGPIKSDFFRVCILYIYGGVYVDADIKPLVPLDNYIDHDVDFATCISYNYLIDCKAFNYNPHFIISKKYNSFLYNTIQLYENYYDNNKLYSYWEWSICTLFNLNIDICISLENNKIIHNGKKYQFLIETLLKDNMYYNYTNIRDENKLQKIKTFEYAFCSYNGKPVLENFTNKSILN